MAAEADSGSRVRNVRKYYFHKVASVELCKFAERAHTTGKDIKIYAKVESDVNSVVSVEYAHKRARW